MIYTVTLNPALDYTASTLSFNKNATNRTENEYIVPGGKGLNVSILLSRLGVDTTAFGFCAGFSGEELKRLLKKQGCICDFCEVAEGFTRINVKLVDEQVTEFNGSGVKIDGEKIADLCQKIATINPCDTLVLSGSIPKGVERDVYLTLANSAPDGTRIVIDASGDALTNALSAKPFLIKPNIDELSEIFATEITTLDDVFMYAEKLQNSGAQNVMVSLGKDGAVLLDSNGNKYKCTPPKGVAVNTVGAGDSMIAAFCAAQTFGKDFAESLRFATSAGSATAYSTWLAEKDDIYALFESTVTVQL